MRKYKFKHMARKAVAIALAAAVAVTGVPGFPGSGTKAQAAETTIDDTRVNQLNDQYFKDKEYKRVSEHDPSIVVGYIDESTYTGKEHVYGVQNDTKTRTKVYFTFGSHMAFAWSPDLQDWTLFENNINKNYNEIFKKNFEWSASGDSHYATAGNMWAPDVIWDKDYVNEDGSKGAWLMYMSINGCSWNSSILLLVSDSLNGNWTPKGDIVYSGFNDTNTPYSYERTNYTEYAELDNGKLPSRYVQSPFQWEDNKNKCEASTWKVSYGAHAIDPCITYNKDNSELWMSYGSWSGGIYMLEIDPATGLRKKDRTYTYEINKSDPYMGIKIAGGESVSGEASYIEYIGNKYYLFMSYGGFAPTGGYNMRVFSSNNITGPYVDLKGNDARYETNVDNITGTTGDRLMSYYKWSFLADGYTAQGHNSAFVDDDGKSYVVYHNKTDDGTAGHEMRVHQLFVAENGGLVTAPFEYCGETLSSSAYNDTDVTGEYGILYMDPSYSNGNVNCVQEQTIELKTDKTVSWGNKTGTWSQDTGKPAVTIVVDGITYQGVFVEQDIEETDYNTMCFTVVGNDGVAIWGYKKASNGQPFDNEVTVAYNALNLKVHIPKKVFIGNKLDFAKEGLYGASYAWQPADTSLISTDGTVQSVSGDKDTQVTLTITSGDYTYNKTFDVTILSEQSKSVLLPIGEESVKAEYSTKAEANEAIGNSPSKQISKYTGLSFSMYADGLVNDWDNIFKKKDSSFQFQFATISYSKGGQWCWYYENGAEISDYAKEMGYTNNIHEAFADGHYYLTISFNTDGSISYYRDGNLMMKYDANLVPSNNPNNMATTISSITEDVITEYRRGNIEFNWDVSSVIVGYATDYDPSTANPNEFTVDGEYKYNDTIIIPANDLAYETENQAIGGTDRKTGWWGAFSDYYKLTGDFDTTFTFNNYGNGGGNIYNSYVMVFANATRGAEGYKEYAVVRSDDWGWGGGDNNSLSGNPIVYKDYMNGSKLDLSTPEGEAAFMDIMEAAEVTANIKRSGSDITINVKAVSLKNSSKSYTRTVTFTETSDDISFFFTVDNCYLEMLSVEGLAQQIGLEDYSTDPWTNWGESTTLQNDFNVTFDFDNYGLSEQFYYNYVFEFRTGSGENYKYVTVSADNRGWGNMGNNTQPDVKFDGTTIDWDTFKEIMNDAHVHMNITRSNGIIQVEADIVSNTDSSKSYKYMVAFSMPDKIINVVFTADHSYIKMNKITYGDIQWYRTASLDSEGTQIPGATGESYVLQKEDVGNYVYAIANDKMVIFQNKIQGRQISVSNIEVDDKEYDGTTKATVKSVTFDGLVNGDNPEYTADMQFDTALAGTDKTVTGTVSLTGDWAKYYVIDNNPVETTASITPKHYIVTYNSTISNATVEVTKDGNTFESGSSAIMTDQLKLSITPSDGYTFAEAPVVKADNATVNTADVKDGVYTYYIINIKDTTNITISGNTVQAQYSVSIADSVYKVAEANHVTLSLSALKAGEGSIIQFIITPDKGYMVKSASISTEKNTCAMSGYEKGNNGIWTFELSKFTGDTIVNNIVLETAKAQVTESGTETSVNIGAANLGETDFSDKDIADAITSAVTNKGNINAIIDETTGKEIVDSELEGTITEIKKAVEDGNNINVSLEVNEKKDLDTATEDIAKQTLSEIEKQAVQDSNRQVSTSKVAMPLDISFYARIDGLNKLKISIKDTGNKEVTIKMSVPSNIVKETNGVKRLYYVIRFHNNDKTIIPCTYNERSNNIIFKSSKFSTYILCYVDTTEKKTQDSNNNNNNNNYYIPGPSATVTPTPTSASPSPTATAPVATQTPAVPVITPTPTDTPDDGQNTPQPTTSNDPSATDAPGNEEPDNNNTTVKVGTKVVVSNLKYTVTAEGSKRTVKFTGVQKKAKKVVVPASVKVSGKKYKVTAIAKNALKGNKKIQKLTIGSNIEKIGKKAFYGCSKLKSIVIKSKKLTAKNIGSKAFKGINSKATIKVPKGKVKSYKKIVRAKGADKKVKVKKS